MSDLHRGSRFLRLLRSICSKTACVRRAIVALFVAVATILATFMIAPTYALSAGEGAGEKVSTEETVDAQSGSAKNEGENKQQTKQSESNSNTEPDKKNTGSSSTLTNNKKSVEKQQPDSNKVDDKANAEKLADETDAKKKAEGAKKKDVSTETALKMNRSAKKPKKPKKPKECNTLSACYTISYDIGSPTVDNKGKTILIKRGDARPITPKFESRPRKNPTFKLEDGLQFKLEQDGEDPVPSWVNFEEAKNGVSSNGFVTLRPGKWDRGIHKFKIGIYHPADTKGKRIDVSVKIDESDISKNDLSLSLYDFGKADDKVSVTDDKITIKQKSKAITNKLFIDSQSAKEPGYIHHHMICRKSGSTDYTLDSVNGLSLGTQTQFEHKEKLDRPEPPQVAANSAVYKNDPYTEESQSWITGTPKDDGTFECKVFAIKDTKLIYNPSGPGGKSGSDSTVADEFVSKTKNSIAQLFANPESNIVDSGMWTNSNDITKTIDWDYKTIKIQFGGKDLALKVYPFKNSDGSLPDALTDKNNKISAMLGMELKPFIEATSKDDGANKITLRVLCKGEKKNNNAAGSGDASTGSTGSTDGNSSTGSTGSGSAVGGSSGGNGSTGSQAEQPSGSSQTAEATWSSNLAELGLSADTAQTRCNEAGDGDKKCTAKDVASQTTMDVSIKPTKVGNYQCVVYALKPEALAKFNEVTTNVTPDTLSAAFASAKLTANKDYAQLAINIHVPKKFELPDTGGQNWNLQLGAVAAVMVSVLAAGFVISQSEACRKLLYERRRC